ncbi:lytic murein transglycosylase [Psychromonas sp. psych-6C06]|nr:lytic murein transglycosylase [Psychromonas sp. psych-6C06]
MLLVMLSIVFSSATFSLSLNQQRTLYSDARSLQEQNNWQQADEKLQMLPDYPLTYLLQYQSLKNNFSVSDKEKISAFIIKNKQYKISNKLQREYMFYLAGQQSWQAFLDFYPALPRSTKLKCFHFQAKMSQNKHDQIWPDVKKVWLSGYSQPNACDSVFKYYLTQKKVSQSLIWQRFQLAHRSNKKALMKYLITLMDADNKELAGQLYKLNQSPQKLSRSSLFTSHDHASYPFLKDMLKRLARSDINLAIQTYQIYDSKVPFVFSDEIELKKYFASRVLIKNKQGLLPWVDKTLPSLGSEKLIAQRIRYAIKYNNWPDIENWINQLPQEAIHSPTWLYWQARVLEEKEQFAQANKLYQKIAGERKYYGFLAAQKLGLTYQLNAQIVEPEVTSLRYVQKQLDHIEELYFHQYMNLVKREWESLLKGRDIDVQRQLGLYAFDKGWPHLSVLASIRSKSWDAINIRFPEVKPELFSENANKFQVPTSYIYAITRQESSFDQFANSPVGATGYMQLMPATAKETARKIGLKEYKKKAQLTESEINVALGTAYFDSLLKRYKGNRILATAAYNAGPNRVDRWKKNKKGRDNKALSMDSWVETIPYKETRRYVKNVLAYNVIYQHIQQQPMEFFNEKELGATY